MRFWCYRYRQSVLSGMLARTKLWGVYEDGMLSAEGDSYGCLTLRRSCVKERKRGVAKRAE